MKTTVEIPDQDLEAARILTGTRTPEEAVVKAVTTFVREREQRRALAQELYGSIPDFMSQEELRRLREES